MLAAVVYLCTIFYVVQGDENLCNSEYKYANDINKEINFTESCNDKSPCIAKCCPVDEILAYNESTRTYSCLDGAYVTSLNKDQLNDYSDVIIYENHVKHYIHVSTKKLDDFIIIYNEDFLAQCSLDTVFFLPKATLFYILESGVAAVRRLNVWNQWFLDFLPGDFCIGHQISLKADGKISKPELVIRMRFKDAVYNTEEKSFDKSTLTAIAMLVSCVFLLMVLAVYVMLPELRNLAGWMMMTYVSALTATFFIRALQILLVTSKATCVVIDLLGHYAVVASFTWMNVMSFDIWWSMRGFRKMRQIHRQGILVKFGWYSLYGWGAPLLLILFMIIIENQDLTHLPGFVKPNYMGKKCLMEGEEQLLYLYCPILITTCINIMLFLMTSYNIWRIKQGVTQHTAANSKRNKKDENRFGIYLKLSLVMGLNWILEIQSAFIEKDSVWWYATDVFNSLTGFFIFVIFICKRRIIIQLCKRLDIEHEFVRKWQPVDSGNTDCTRLNSRNGSSRRKTLDSVTDTSHTSDVDQDKNITSSDKLA